MSLTISKTSIIDLPPELLCQVAFYVADPSIVARCCKIFAKASTNSFSLFLACYQKFPSLKYLADHFSAYFEDHASQSRFHAEEKVKQIYRYITAQAKPYADLQPKISKIQAGHPGPLNPKRMELTARLTQKLLAAEHSIRFFSFVAEEHPSFEKALSSKLDQTKDLLNHFRKLNDFLVQPENQPLLSRITELAILGSHTYLEWVPTRICALFALKEIDLSSNHIFSLPPQIGLLAQLEKLDLSRNPLGSIPKELTNCSRLTEIRFSNCKIQALPKEIENLGQLQKIDLSHNDLEAIPSEIGSLKKLTDLNLSFNKIQQLPPEIGALVSLEKLNLFQNKLVRLPTEMEKLISLRILNLTCNYLEYISQAIIRLPRLKRLSMECSMRTNY